MPIIAVVEQKTIERKMQNRVIKLAYFITAIYNTVMTCFAVLVELYLTYLGNTCYAFDEEVDNPGPLTKE